MEVFKNVFFNTDKVIGDSDIKVTYAGKLFQNGAEEVVIHYGYGENWENSSDVVMEKTELGYQANLHVENEKKLSFCFRDAQGNWDNNEGENYTFNIETNNVPVSENEVQETSLIEVTPTWAELFKKTFKNLFNYVSGLFSKKEEIVEK